MSQQRARKAYGGVLEGGRQGMGKLGESGPQPAPAQQSRSKIPKTLRYELENALVGLCDVWFEEIKPHLVRNKIKVHVHGAGPAGDESALPPGAPGCSHLDPALSAGVCQLCRLLFNAANSIESAVSQAASAASVALVAAPPALAAPENMLQPSDSMPAL